MAREVMREVMHGALGDAPAPQRGNGRATYDPPDDAAIIAKVPAPPVAAVLRPSTWSSPASPGEVIGDRPAPAAQVIGDHDAPGRVEAVTIDTDEDLERFVSGLVSRVSNPRDLASISTGRLRFALRRSTPSAGADASAPGQPQPARVRVVKGAITERAVRDAAAEGARLVLAQGAVLTPLARDRARALGVEIERERKC
ncbi:MAG: hypothetical protein ACRDNK_13695 [Solirubrobacteraceae bacterium]